MCVMDSSKYVISCSFLFFMIAFILTSELKAVTVESLLYIDSFSGSEYIPLKIKQSWVVWYSSCWSCFHDLCTKNTKSQ